MKKFQFSKLHVIFADALVAFVYISNVWLVAHDFQPISDIATAIITVYGAFATGGYFTLCGVRDCSLNKYGIGKEYVHENQLEAETEQP